MNKETTRDQRLKIIALRDATGWPWHKIASEYSIKESTCKMVYQRWKKAGSPSNRPRTGRPVFFDDAKKRQLEAFVTSSPRTRRLGWEEIAAEMGYQCTGRTVKAALESLGYHKRMARKK